MTKLFYFLQMAPRRQIRLAVYAILLVTVEAVLTITTFNSTRRFAWRLSNARARARPAERPSPAEMSRDLVTASHQPIIARLGVDCLAESVLLEALLRSRGLSPMFRLGVNDQRAAGAHAWVELDGIPLNETLAVYDRLRPFSSALPPPNPRR